jgi:hypothetical protein
MIPPRTLGFLVKVLPFETPSLLPQTAQRLGDVFSVVTIPRTTYPIIAPLLVIPTASHAIYTELNLLESGRENPARDTVIHKTVPLVVIEPRPANMANILVPYVDPPPTPPSYVMPLCNLLPVITPFIPDEWKKALKLISPFNKFLNIPIRMRFGFDMGVCSPPTTTYTPPNHNSAQTTSCPISIMNYH